MDLLFDASKEHGLIIYDRQSTGENPQYVFPDRFQEFVEQAGVLRIVKQAQEHLIFLNVNSVETH